MPMDAVYDVVIAGAGPAGLSAARTLARLGFRTLVLEQQMAPAQVRHPCSGVLAAMPGYITGERCANGVSYAELDLTIPHAMITGYLSRQAYISPYGYQLAAGSQGGAVQALVVDKAALLEQMAGAAGAAGAELRYGVAATGLLRAGRQVVGVSTVYGDVGSALVVAAEGAAGQLCTEAGIYARRTGGQRFAATASEELIAPGITAQDTGSFVTLGRRYTAAPRAMGSVVLPAPGRAIVSFTIFDDQPRHHTDSLLWAYLDEYVRSDGRVRHLLAGARILSRAGYQRTLGEPPVQVVRDGFMATGDAVVPGGHMGVLPAAYVGRQAALIAAEALDAADPSATALRPYDQLLRGTILADLEAESRAWQSLTGMTDDEIDNLFQLLARVQRSEPFFADWQTLPWVAVRWLMAQVAPVAAEYELFQRFLLGPAAVPYQEGLEARAPAESVPVAWLPVAPCS